MVSACVLPGHHARNAIATEREQDCSSIEWKSQTGKEKKVAHTLGKVLEALVVGSHVCGLEGGRSQASIAVIRVVGVRRRFSERTLWASLSV